MDWFLEAGRIDEALRVANALYRFWITKQRFAEGAAAFGRVLATPGGDDLLRGKAALYAGCSGRRSRPGDGSATPR